MSCILCGSHAPFYFLTISDDVPHGYDVFDGTHTHAQVASQCGRKSGAGGDEEIRKVTCGHVFVRTTVETWAVSQKREGGAGEGEIWNKVRLYMD